jgi:hypothetical protein
VEGTDNDMLWNDSEDGDVGSEYEEDNGWHFTVKMGVSDTE